MCAKTNHSTRGPGPTDTSPAGACVWACCAARVQTMFSDLVHFTQLTTQTDPNDVKSINFFVKFTNDWPDVETYSGSNNPGGVWVW